MFGKFLNELVAEVSFCKDWGPQLKPHPELHFAEMFLSEPGTRPFYCMDSKKFNHHIPAF